jgi:hypothetical protein
VRQGQLAHEREPHPDAAHALPVAGLEPLEALEDPRVVRRRDARPPVRHPARDLPLVAADGQRDRGPVRLPEREGVSEQVVEDGADLLRVHPGQAGRGRGGQLHAQALRRLAAELVGHPDDQLPDVHEAPG